MVTAEFSPYVKTGGLADAVSALSRELRRSGDDVRVLLPFHGSIQECWRRDMRPLPSPFSVHLGGEHWGRIHELVEADGLRVYFLEHHQFFDRWRPYDDGYRGYEDNPQRFAFLCRAAVDLADFLDWTPDVFHCHDWMAALVPVYLETVARRGRLCSTASLLTIHNIAHQGYADRSLLSWAGLPDWLYCQDKLEACGGVNVLKGGLYFANKLTTVSPTYAQEIRGAEFGCGLQDVLQFRGGDLIGVLNGIDCELWNPATDSHIAAHYDSKCWDGKWICKDELRRSCGLEIRPSVPLFGVVARLHWQKGLDILADALPWILNDMNLQFILLGAGDGQLEEHFRALARAFPGRVAVHIGYDETFAHRIVAGCDFFFMPSRFEPCGLSQLYSLRYGTLPIVRSTGGLRDTVRHYDERTGEGTGFFFNDLTPSALHGTAGWACHSYHNRPDHINAMIRQAMDLNFSWKASAGRYRDCYRWALGAKR
ncbi:MAG: glycogen synthase GlgA [Puniceicoccales bacterium]|jgi:starch synthase|nr:glycogen synthase GlgA [Puniceicoccales bacterium]